MGQEADLTHSLTGSDWRLTHLGRLLGAASVRFDARVQALMAADAEVPLALANLARRGQLGAAHVHVTRHLPVEGARLSDLAERAGMTKQAMGDLMDQCVAWGMVRREADPLDARARRIVFTEVGLQWLAGFQRAVQQAEREFRADVGDAVATVVAMGLEAYGSGAYGSGVEGLSDPASLQTIPRHTPRRARFRQGTGPTL